MHCEFDRAVVVEVGEGHVAGAGEREGVSAPLEGHGVAPAGDLVDAVTVEISGGEAIIWLDDADARILL